jgi:hypothetical protein
MAMERRFRQRVRAIEKQINAEKRKREEEWIETKAYWRPQARFHAAAVAAIVLHREPKIDEPLGRAWLRALERYEIHVSDPTSNNSPANVGAQLLAKLLKFGSEESDTFSEIFRDAPAWLLTFTCVRIDAKLLNFKLPDSSGSVEMGRDGFNEAELWPLLPTGIMTAGEPLDRSLFKKPKKRKSGVDCLKTDDIIFLLEIRKKPEDEWSLTEQRRHSQLIARISKK